jgi:methyl-accepting chemotaxis protein
LGFIAMNMTAEGKTVAQVNHEVDTIEHLVNANASMATEVAAAAQQQSAGTERMTNLSVNLAHHSQTLQELVARFHVDEAGTPPSHPAAATTGRSAG